jgi:hypothetical protein
MTDSTTIQISGKVSDLTALFARPGEFSVQVIEHNPDADTSTVSIRLPKFNLHRAQLQAV